MDQKFFVIRNINELKNCISKVFEELNYADREGYQQFEDDFEIKINLDDCDPDKDNCDYKLKEDGKLYPEDFEINEDWKEFIPGILYIYFEEGFDRWGSFNVKIKKMESLKNLGLNINCPCCGNSIIDDTLKNDNQVEDKPTKISYYEDTDIVHCKYWKDNNDRFHRVNNKPAFIEYYKDGSICMELYYINGKLHRDNDKPASIQYYKNGNINIELYYINGKPHRDNDKPSYIRYYKNGNINVEMYFSNGIEYRNNCKPSYIYYNENGAIITIEKK